MFYLIAVVVFALSTTIFYNLNYEYNLDKTFLTLSTFLFSVFNGFFISRQAGRYNDVRNVLSKIDANFSTIYRHATNLDKVSLDKVKDIIQDYYKKRKRDLHSYINTKANTISDLHVLIKDKFIKKPEGMEAESLKKILSMADDIQQHRKLLIALSEEKVSHYQYVIVIVLALVLMINLTFINSYGQIIESLMKASFALVIVVVIWTLNRFDNLKIFHGEIGDSTGQDVLEIIRGKK